jgi:hypothetical protein
MSSQQRIQISRRSAEPITMPFSAMYVSSAHAVISCTAKTVVHKALQAVLSAELYIFEGITTSNPPYDG